MAKVVKRHWTSDTSAGLPRKDRRSCDYEAYIPDPLVGRQVVLEGPVAADVSEAEAALARFNVEVRALSDSEALARLLLRTEAVASSRIEGLEIGARRLLHADAERRLGETSRDVSAADVLGNIDAMLFAVETAGEGDPLSVGLLLDIHRRLLRGTRLESHAGRLRNEQNWIGGSSFNPCSAEFVPPPPSWCPSCSPTSASSATKTCCPPSPKPPSLTRSSRPSTRSSTAMDAWVAPSSTWSCAGAARSLERCRRSR